MPLSPRFCGWSFTLVLSTRCEEHLDSAVALSFLTWRATALHSPQGLVSPSKQQASKRCHVPGAAVLSVCRMRASEHCLTDRPRLFPSLLCTRLWRSLRKNNNTIIPSPRGFDYLLLETTATATFALRYTASAASRTAHHPRSSQTQHAVHDMRNAPADPRSSLHINLPMRIAHTVDIQPTGTTALWRILELT